MPPTPRLRSIDVLRGLVMVLMAIDHVRVYSARRRSRFSPARARFCTAAGWDTPARSHARSSRAACCWWSSS